MAQAKELAGGGLWLPDVAAEAPAIRGPVLRQLRGPGRRPRWPRRSWRPTSTPTGAAC